MISPLSYLNYRSYLKDVYFQNCESHHQYRLRDFADALGISPSHLSQILNKKDGLSAKTAKVMAKGLELDEVESQHLADLAIVAHSKSNLQIEQAKGRLAQTYKGAVQLSKEDVTSYSSLDRHLIRHALFILKVPVYGSLKELSLFLGQDEFFLRKELGSMLQEGSILDSGGFYESSQTYVETPSDRKIDKIKDIHLELLERAQKAQLNKPIKEREISHTLMSISKSKLPEAKELMREFRKKFNALLTGPQDKDFDSIYCLGLSFFELSDTSELQD